MKFRMKDEMVKYAPIFTVVKLKGDCEKSQRALVVQGKCTADEIQNQ